jgi:hypothetical protein
MIESIANYLVIIGACGGLVFSIFPELRRGLIKKMRNKILFYLLSVRNFYRVKKQKNIFDKEKKCGIIRIYCAWCGSVKLSECDNMNTRDCKYYICKECGKITKNIHYYDRNNDCSINEIEKFGKKESED